MQAFLEKIEINWKNDKDGAFRSLESLIKPCLTVGLGR